MTHYRDAKTGEYISKEEAQERDRSTWVEETEFDKGAFLKKVFESLMYKSFGTPMDGRVVKMEEIQKLFSKYSDDISPENVFINRLNKALVGISYMSETDAKIKPFLGGKVSDVNKEVILTQTNHSPDEEVEELDFSEFFDNLSTTQEWFTDYEISQVEKYVVLRDVLEQHLKNIKVFKVGKVTKDIYIVGCDPEGNLRGVHTVAVET